MQTGVIMGKYVLNRLIWLVVIIIATAFVIFTLLYFTPGDPAAMMLSASATQEDIAALRSSLGIDRPYLTQLGSFLFHAICKLDLGNSWTYQQPVLEVLLERLPRTLIIGCCAMAINLTLGLLFGIFAGTHEGKWQDSLIMTIAMVFVSCPNFWVALMLIILFARNLGWLPASGVKDGVKSYILPVITSTLSGIATNSRQTRSSILEVFREDYITTARSKGLAERKVVRKHMLPNALMPIITVIGTGFGHITAGSPVIESVFSIPGVGLYMLNAINQRDYPAVRGCVLFFAVWTAVVMLMVDLLYAYIDPRIKARYKGKKV